MDDIHKKIINMLDKDREMFLAFGEDFIKTTLTAATSQNHDIPELLASYLPVLLKDNAQIVFEYSASPIERILLNGLALSFISATSVLQFMKPATDAPRVASDYRACVIDLTTSMQEYMAHHGTLNGFEKSYQPENRKTATNDEHRAWHWLMLYGFMQFGYAPHVIIQPGFPEIRIDGRPVRADLYCFMPNNPRFNLIVECDGYEYHADHDTFLRDRQRDRAFAAAGYQVLRYAGREIVRNPYAVSTQLFEYLMAYRRPIARDPFPERRLRRRRPHRSP
jgi:REase_MTES_1575